MDYSILYKLGLSLLLGAFIGIERQIHHVSIEAKVLPSLGLRTFSLIAVLGTIGGLIYLQIPSLFYIITSAVFLLIIGHYVFDSISSKDFGITTEVSLIFTYIIGVLLAIGILSNQLIIGITVILLLLLSQKERLKHYISMIEQEEIRSFISYLVIALVVLPTLPNASFSLSSIPWLVDTLSLSGIDITLYKNIEIVNPFKLWLFIALITGIEVIGYILERVFGKNKGWLVASFAGGFISSTATTQSLAQYSKRSKSTNFLVAAAIFSSLASLLQHILLILPLNINLFIQTLPIHLTMILICAILASIFLRNNHKLEVSEKLSRGKLFYLYPAIKFALLFLFIKIASGIAFVVFGTSGFIASNALGAIPGLDPVTINISEAAGSLVDIKLGLFTLLLALGVNMGIKCLLSFQGSREFAYKFSLSAAAIISGGALMLTLLKGI